MMAMPLLLEQLQRRLVEIAAAIQQETTPPAAVRILRTADTAARRPAFPDADAPLLEPGGGWREPVDTIVWLRFGLSRPPDWPVEHTALVAQRFGTSPREPDLGPRRQRGNQRLQGMLYLDGQPYHGLDQYHRLIYLPPGPDYHFAASVWTGSAELDWQPNPVFRLVRIDPGASALYFDLLVVADALSALRPDEPLRPDFEQLAETALLSIDWSCPGSAAFRASLARAHEQLQHGLASLHGATYEPTITAIGHAHIDCAWLWPIAQTREKAGRTWTTVLHLMHRYPEYHFLASTPQQYEWVKELYPETFEGIRQRVAEGRWEPVGGMWVEADCNLPDGESLVRQILLGTRYFEREFGVETSIAWLPDSFGFTWALPSLLAAAGLRSFVTQKLGWSQTNRVPHDTFRWRGPDGSSVLAHFLTTPDEAFSGRATYNGTLLPRIARGAWSHFQDRHLHHELLEAFGYGDGGGGPTLEMLEAGRRLHDLPGFPRVQQGTAGGFFERLEASLAQRSDVPVWDGELYLEYHRGTYTSQARQKLRNVHAQRLYHAAELYATCARALLGADYPTDELNAGWRLLLTNQFHDILPGSAISQVYQDAEADYVELQAIGQRVLDRALERLGGAIDLAAPSLVVFNPSPYPLSDYLELPSELTPRDVPSQPLPNGQTLAWCADVPPNGYRAFPLGPAAPATGSPLQVSATEIETPFWRIELDPHGRIARLWDRQREREVVAPGRQANRLVVFEDKPLQWDAWDIDAFHLAKWLDVDDLEAATVLEAGPERGVLELRWRFGQATRVVQRLVVSARQPRIDFVTHIDWQERQSLLKVAFPTPLRNRRATYEIQFGTIDRPTHRNTSWDEAAFEVPAQRWVDLSEARYGVALLADCKHGYSAHEDTLWLSLLKGAIDPDPEADRGEHTFTYSLLPHGPGLDEVRQAAYALSRPPLWRSEPAHAGPLATQFCLAAASTPGVLVETAKYAEDEDALILRLYEADGGATTAQLTLGLPDGTAIEAVDLLERHPRPLGPAIPLRAHQVQTLRIAAGAAHAPSPSRDA